MMVLLELMKAVLTVKKKAMRREIKLLTEENQQLRLTSINRNFIKYDDWVSSNGSKKLVRKFFRGKYSGVRISKSDP